MDTYYEELQETIRRSQEEIDHLNKELRGLYSVEKDTPRDVFQKEEAQIKKHLAKQKAIIEKNQNIINNYDPIKEFVRKAEELGLTADIIKNISNAQKELNSSDEQESSPNLEDEGRSSESTQIEVLTPASGNTVVGGTGSTTLSDDTSSIGTVTISAPDDTSAIGTGSTTTPDDTSAIGTVTISAPDDTSSIGTGSTSTPDDTSAIGTVTISAPDDTSAGGTGSTALSDDTSSIGTVTISAPGNTSAIGTGSTRTPGNTPARGTGSARTPGNTPATPEIKKGYRRIIQELTAGLKLEPKMGKRYEASNIKVAQSFRNELHSGNYLYNVVHVIPAIIKIPIQLIRKVSSRILLKAKDKANIKKLEDRLENLSKTDLETLLNDYIGGNIVQEHLPTIFNTLLNKRLQKYVQEKIDKINAKIKDNYIKVFKSAKEIDRLKKEINDPSKSEEEKQECQAAIEREANGKAKVIKSIIDNRVKVNKLYSSGMHGFSEDVRADSTGLSLVGKRFAKKNNLDNDLQEQLAIFEDAINKAIAEKNDQAALEAFVKMEMLYSDNTKIEKSILGNRSVGSKVYTPIQTESLDYSTDPFVRDLMTTIATTTAVIGTVNAIKTHIETDRMVDEYNRTIATANKAGDEIVSKRDTFSRGMEAQSQQDVLNASNALERDALNRVNWRLHGSDYTKYRGLDDANHAWYNDFYEQTKAALEEVASKRANGNISAQQALEEISTINSKTQSTMSGIMSDCLKVAHEYNPTVIYDNHGIQSVMEYMVQNPQAIPEMNEAMTDVVKIGESLRGLSNEQIQSFQNLSGNLATTLLATASAGALAQSVSSNMQQNIRNNKYGNEITNMVGEYAESRRQENQQESRTR